MAATLITLPITMLVQHNFLRVIRNKTQLTQLDIAFILQIADFANVSRWEQGSKKPNVEMLLGYHLLFDVPIESLFDLQKDELRKILLPRIRERVDYLGTLNSEPKVQDRIGYLVSAASRLAA